MLMAVNCRPRWRGRFTRPPRNSPASVPPLKAERKVPKAAAEPKRNFATEARPTPTGPATQMLMVAKTTISQRSGLSLRTARSPSPIACSMLGRAAVPLGAGGGSGMRKSETNNARELRAAMKGLLGLDQRRGERRPGGEAEGVRGAEGEGEQVEVPELDDVEPDERRHGADEHGADHRRRHQHAARREAVGHRVADQHQRRPRHRRRHQDGAEGEARAGELQHEPGQRHQVELVAQERDRAAQPQVAKVGERQRVSGRSGSVGGGFGGEGAHAVSREGSGRQFEGFILRCRGGAPGLALPGQSGLGGTGGVGRVGRDGRFEGGLEAGGELLDQGAF